MTDNWFCDRLSTLSFPLTMRRAIFLTFVLLVFPPYRRSGGEGRGAVGGQADHAGGRTVDRARARNGSFRSSTTTVASARGRPGQRGGVRAGGNGVDVGRQHARPRPVRRPGEPLRRLPAGPRTAERVHIWPRRQPRPDVRARVRHHVPCRMLRHVAPARVAGEALEGVGDHRQQPEQTGRLAISSCAAKTPIFRSPCAK